jgi:hypothetical protein
MTAEEIDDLTAKWELLTAVLDYQADKWYESIDGVWTLISFPRVNDCLLELGFGDPPVFVRVRNEAGEEQWTVEPDPERTEIIANFRYRDHDSHRRVHDDLKRAQLRFKGL